MNDDKNVNVKTIYGSDNYSVKDESIVATSGMKKNLNDNSFIGSDSDVVVKSDE